MFIIEQSRPITAKNKSLYYYRLSPLVRGGYFPHRLLSTIARLSFSVSFGICFCMQFFDQAPCAQHHPFFAFRVGKQQQNRYRNVFRLCLFRLPLLRSRTCSEFEFVSKSASLSAVPTVCPSVRSTVRLSVVRRPLVRGGH